MHGMEYVLAVRAGRASATRTWAAAWPDLHLLGVVLSDSLDKDRTWHVMQGLFSFGFRLKFNLVRVILRRCLVI